MPFFTPGLIKLHAFCVKCSAVQKRAQCMLLSVVPFGRPTVIHSGRCYLQGVLDTLHPPRTAVGMQWLSAPCRPASWPVVTGTAQSLHQALGLRSR